MALAYWTWIGWLQRLERIDARAARLVELRFFAGMSIEQAAETMDLSKTTAKRDWQFARSWLQTQLQEDRPDSNP